MSKTRINALPLALVTLLTGLACAQPAERNEPLPRVTVSGISSGAYMATQVHVALSGTVQGAALLAGGPYGCAQGDLALALGRCIKHTDVDPSALVAIARERAAKGTIDPLENLSDDAVWVFHGALDAVVGKALPASAAEFYRAWLPAEAVVQVNDLAVAHGWPTVNEGIACEEMGAEFINRCDYDAAGILLQYLYGPLESPVPARDAGLQTLDQSGWAPEQASFAESGFAYVPQSCESDPGRCRLHVAFHGCRQGKEFIGSGFASRTGLNGWAEANRIVVLYPQVNSSPLNPQGCWDWWGYTGPDYDLRTGRQISGIAALIRQWSDGKAVPDA